MTPAQQYAWQWGGPAPRPPDRADHARHCDYLSAVQTYLSNPNARRQADQARGRRRFESIVQEITWSLEGRWAE